MKVIERNLKAVAKMVKVKFWKIKKKNMFSGKRSSGRNLDRIIKVIIIIIYFQTFVQDVCNNAGKILKPSL